MVDNQFGDFYCPGSAFIIFCGSAYDQCGSTSLAMRTGALNDEMADQHIQFTNARLNILTFLTFQRSLFVNNENYETKFFRVEVHRDLP